MGVDSLDKIFSGDQGWRRSRCGDCQHSFDNLVINQTFENTQRRLFKRQLPGMALKLDGAL